MISIVFVAVMALVWVPFAGGNAAIPDLQGLELRRRNPPFVHRLRGRLNDESWDSAAGSLSAKFRGIRTFEQHALITIASKATVAACTLPAR